MRQYLLIHKPILPKLLHKLLQEPDIIFVHQRAQSIQTQSEREAGELFGIDRDGAQHVRVDHSRPAHLDPAGAFADATATAAAFEAGVIDLRARFDEREIGWAEARACFGAEEQPHELLDRAFQDAERDAAVYKQSFDLVEHRIMRGVGGVAAENAPWRGHAQRRAALLHRVNLHRRSLRTQRQPLVDVERVLRAARRVIGRDVQRVEVVEVVLDLRPVLDLVAHRDKDVFDRLPQQRDRMKVAPPYAASGQRYVNALFGQLFGLSFRGETGLQFFDLGFDVIFQLVEPLPRHATLIGRKIAERFHFGKDQAFFACSHALPDPAVAQRPRIGVGTYGFKLNVEIFSQFLDSIRHKFGLLNLKTQDPSKGLRESWVGNYRILPEPKSDGGFARIQRLLRRAYEFGESLRLVDGQVGENLPVEVDPGHFQTVHELAVIQTAQPRRRADADDPERTVIALLDLAPDVGEFERALNRFSHRTV